MRCRETRGFSGAAQHNGNGNGNGAERSGAATDFTSLHFTLGSLREPRRESGAKEVKEVKEPRRVAKEREGEREGKRERDIMGARDKKKKKPEGLEDKQVDVDDVDETTRRKKQKTTEIQQEEEEEEEEEEDESFDSDDFEDSEDDFEDGGENEKLEEEEEEDVETSFEFFDPSEGDFLGMKGLLNAYLDGETYDASGLVDEIIKQKTVGSVVRLEEQLDPIAVVSVMNLKKHEHKQFLVDVVNFVCANAPTEKDRERMKMVVLDGKTKHRHGLVVSERVVNTPLELSSPLQQAIFDEIDWATEDEPTEEKRDEYKFTHFLM